MPRNARKGRRQNKKTKNDGASGLSTATDVTSLDISDQGERNDTGEKPRVLLNKNFSERYKKIKHLRQESQKPGDIWIMDYVIMNQTTEGHEQETVALVIMDTYSSLVRVIPCKKRGNVLPHILDTITLWDLRVQAHHHRIQGQIENFIRYLKDKIRSIKFLKGIPDRFWPDLAKMYESIHNFMEARVTTAGEEGTFPIGLASRQTSNMTRLYSFNLLRTWCMYPSLKITHQSKTHLWGLAFLKAFFSGMNIRLRSCVHTSQAWVVSFSQTKLSFSPMLFHS